MRPSAAPLEQGLRHLLEQSSASKLRRSVWQTSMKRSSVEGRSSERCMAKHLVLMFAYHYPPENSIGGERPFRFSKYLSRLGYSCRVFTAADQTGREDPNTEFIADPFFAEQRRKLPWQFERALRKIFLPGELGTQWSY